MRLFHLLKRRPLCNNLHFILVAILLLMLSIKYYFFFIALGIYLIFIVLKTKYIIPVLILVLLIVLRYSISLIVKNIEIEWKINNRIIGISVSKEKNSEYFFC